MEQFYVRTFGDVLAGQYVICQGEIQKVSEVRLFGAGVRREGPVGLSYPAVELVTARGSRWGAPHISTNIYEPRERRCLRCALDLTDVMGVAVFAGGKPVPGLLCIECGGNGANGMPRDEYARLIGGWAELTYTETQVRNMAASVPGGDWSKTVLTVNEGETAWIPGAPGEVRGPCKLQYDIYPGGVLCKHVDY